MNRCVVSGLWRRFALLATALLCLPIPASGMAGPIAAGQLVLDVELDPATRQIAVQAEWLAEDAHFRFVLHESLRPVSAQAGARALQVRPLGARGALRAWALDNPAGEALVLRYAGTLPALEQARDHRGVLQSMPPMASPQGSYLSAGSAWYPRPADLFSYAVNLRVRGAQRALVPGRLVEESLPAPADGVYRAHFVFEHPTDGIDLMAGPWTVRERTVAQDDGRPLRLRTYFPPALDGEPGLADGYLADSQRYIERYSGLIGAYPFTEFSVVASPLPTGFGMPTLTYIGEQVLRLPFIRATSLGHEVLHNWWGNGVMVDYARGNWSEGLTTFMADYAYRVDDSAAQAREMRLGWIRDFAALPADAHAPLAEFRSRTHGAAAAIGYGKAAMLFVMLEDEIGAEAFSHAIRSFWTQHRFRTAGWEDLRAAFERAAGRSLEGFFSQWLERRGGAAPGIERAWLERAAEAGRDARIRLVLTQPAPAYALRLEVRASASDLSSTRSVGLSETRAEAVIDLPFVPETLSLDPDLRLWRVPEPEQLPPILRQWIVAPQPRLVLADALALPGGLGASAAVRLPEAAISAAARTLAQRLFEREAVIAGFEALHVDGGPVLLIGTMPAVERALAQAGLATQVEGMPAGGSARVWTVRRTEGPPLAVVAGQDAAALEALVRPLPHYGGQSWLVFDGAKLLERGVWVAPGRMVKVER